MLNDSGFKDALSTRDLSRLNESDGLEFSIAGANKDDRDQCLAQALRYLSRGLQKVYFLKDSTGVMIVRPNCSMVIFIEYDSSNDQNPSSKRIHVLSYDDYIEGAIERVIEEKNEQNGYDGDSISFGERYDLIYRHGCCPSSPSIRNASTRVLYIELCDYGYRLSKQDRLAVSDKMFKDHRQYEDDPYGIERDDRSFEKRVVRELLDSV